MEPKPKIIDCIVTKEINNAKNKKCFFKLYKFKRLSIKNDTHATVPQIEAIKI